VDVPGLTLVTANSGTGTYLIFVNMEMLQTTSSSEPYIIINVDGVDITLSQRNVRLESMKRDSVTTQALKATIANGDVIKVRWRMTGPGNIDVDHRSLIILQV
jgi:hypothetical protein